MSEWVEVTLHEIGLLARGKSKYRPRWADHLYGGYMPFVQTGDIRKANKFVTKYDQTYSEAGVEQSKVWERGTLCITIAANIAEVGILDFNACFPDSVMGFIPDKDKSTTDFVYYLLKHFQKVIQLQAIGSVQDNINLGTFNKVTFNLPPLPEQKAIAHILGTLDDKIELNRQMNQTLENMAQALFKSWFVDFDPVLDNALAAGNEIPEPLKAKAEKRKAIAQDKKLIHTNPELAAQFPNKFRFNETLNKWIPEGWEVKSLDSQVIIDTTSIKPFEYPERLYKHFSIPAFDNGCRASLDLGSEIKSNKYKIKKGAILVSKLNPSTKRIWYVGSNTDENSICSTEFMQMIPKKAEYSSFFYLLFNSVQFQNDLESTVTGSTGSRQRAQPKMVAKIQINIPRKPEMNSYKVLCDDLLQKQYANHLAIESLIQLRDTLLPKLISGKVRLPEEFVGRFE